jgi:hypothetical protein
MTLTHWSFNFFFENFNINFNAIIEIFDETKETANFETLGGTLSDLLSLLVINDF